MPFKSKIGNKKILFEELGVEISAHLNPIDQQDRCNEALD